MGVLTFSSKGKNFLETFEDELEGELEDEQKMNRTFEDEQNEFG